MPERVGRMISLEVGVADAAAGRKIASQMMGESSPQPGSVHTVADGSQLTYLRAFEVPERADSTNPAIWVNFSITYDSNAEADALVGWLLDALEQHGSPVTLRVDTSPVAVELDAMTELIRRKIRTSV